MNYPNRGYASSLVDALKLAKLGLNRLHSDKDYQDIQSYIAKSTLDSLKAKGFAIESAKVLELGAGRGGHSLILNQRAKKFLATDLMENDLFKKVGIPFEIVDVMQPFPFEDNSFDFIYTASLIEHVSSPDNLLSETWRVLVPEGILFLSFPPFYSLAMVGGHMFKPFHFLGEKIAVKLTNFFRRRNYSSYAECFGDHGLYPLTITKAKELIERNNFTLQDTFTRMSEINTAIWPWFIKDLMTWHVCYIAVKN